MNQRPTVYEGNDPYIFISYAHADDAVVLPLIAGLQTRGLRVWYDHGIGDTSLWQKVIAEHLAYSHCVLAFISQASLKSPNCRKEINFSINLSERPDSSHLSPLPIYMDNAEPDYEMQMVLLPLQSRYYAKYPSADAFLDSLALSEALQCCRASEKSKPAPEPDSKKSLDDLQFELAELLYKGKKYVSAAVAFQTPAENGHADSQFALARCYKLGHGVTADLSEAAKWYHKAAEQGHAPAQNDLACMYYSGKGIPKDYSESFRWFRKAAEQGHPVAQFNLGVCYKNGEGVPKDVRQALYWFQKAYDNGHLRAKDSIARCEAEIKVQADPSIQWVNQAEKLNEEGK